jgi:hypothetical protein
MPSENQLVPGAVNQQERNQKNIQQYCTTENWLRTGNIQQQNQSWAFQYKTFKFKTSHKMKEYSFKLHCAAYKLRTRAIFKAVGVDH